MSENQEQNQEQSESPVRSRRVRAEGEGKTTSEAYAKAMARLEEQAGEFDVEDVDVAVISEGSKGFLGMGSTMARVEVSILVEVHAGEDEGEEHPEAGPETAARLEDFLERVLGGIGIEADIRVSDRGEEMIANIEGDDLGLFIGRHGQTMDAVQYLANIVIFRNSDRRKRIVIDAEDYRGRRMEILHGLADRGAKEVSRGRRQYELKPMSASERRIIHVYLQERDDVETYSDGREPYRRVIIARAGTVPGQEDSEDYSTG